MTQKVAMLELHGESPRDEDARRRLADALEGAQVGEPDATGVFEVSLEADDQDAALETVWDAVAAAGVDDHIVFLEHPELPGHWRHRARAAP